MNLLDEICVPTVKHSNIIQPFILFQQSDNLLPEDSLIILSHTLQRFNPGRSITPGESCPLSILIHLNGSFLVVIFVPHVCTSRIVLFVSKRMKYFEQMKINLTKYLSTKEFTNMWNAIFCGQITILCTKLWQKAWLTYDIPRSTVHDINMKFKSGTRNKVFIFRKQEYT